MAKYKIICNDVGFLGRSVIGNEYHGATFEGVAYTDDEFVAHHFKNAGYHHGGKPIFEVVEEDSSPDEEDSSPDEE